MLASHEIKRQILQSADSSIVKQRMDKNPPGISEGELIEIGNELERMTKTAGWTIAEQYMLTKMNLVGLAVSEKGSDVNRGIAKGFIEFMQWIHLAVKKKDEIIEKERLKYETKTVPEDEAE